VALQTCIAPPNLTIPPAVNPMSPAAYLDTLRTAAAKAVVPCHVHLCDKAFWWIDEINASTHATVLVQTTTACNATSQETSDYCKGTYSLCDNTGAMLTDISNNKPATVTGSAGDGVTCQFLQ
jgi:hypothetical protein